MARHRTSTTETGLWRVEGGRGEARPDRVATEEPLEIRLRWRGEPGAPGEPGNQARTVAVTMRTPGNDAELALGFLWGEGVLAGRQGAPGVAEPEANVVEVDLGEGPEPELASLERHFFTSSACGVCGKVGLEALRLPAPLPAGPELAPELIYTLPDALRRAQGVFEATGGLHAAGLFDAAGRLLALREDVGRHNALDKLVGWALHQGRLPLHHHLVLVSGRTSYEILQKCLAAGAPVVCAVSAPSSLAVEVAQRFGMTLIGFLRGDRFNVYSGVERILGLGDIAAVASAASRPGARRSPLPVILTRG